MKISGTQLNETPIMKAVMELDKRLAEMSYPAFDLNIVGGFALALKGLRENAEDTVDINFVGKNFNDSVRSIIEEIGEKHGVGKYWLNNDLMFHGSSVEDFEFTTGKLHFTPVDASELSVINLNVLDEKDLLRMKLIAIDTELAAIEYGGSFERLQDFEDIVKLKESLGYDYIAMENLAGDYLLTDDVFDAISAYEMGGEKQVADFILEKTGISVLADDIDRYMEREADELEAVM